MDPQERMLDIFRRIEALGLRDAPLANSELSLPQLALLACVGRAPGSHANEVAEIMGLTAPTVSVALRRLEEGGWLRREPDAQDRRAVHLFLTKNGVGLLARVHAYRTARIAQLLETLSGDEQTQLLNLLEKATAHLEEHQDIKGKTIPLQE